MKPHVASQLNATKVPVAAERSEALNTGADPTLAVHEPTESGRARWAIDVVLEKMIHQPVRVAAEAFAPIGSGASSKRLILTRDLILPDNTRTDGLPVYFEGVLLEVTRQIGVVHVRLGPPRARGRSAEGYVRFRERIAVILRGPAVVRLAIPFHVERLPASMQNYWLDLKMPKAQFLLRFGREG